MRRGCAFVISFRAKIISIRLEMTQNVDCFLSHDEVTKQKNGIIYSGRKFSICYLSDWMELDRHIFLRFQRMVAQSEEHPSKVPGKCNSTYGRGFEPRPRDKVVGKKL